MFGHCPAIAGGSRDDAAGTVEVVSSLNAAVLIKSSQLRIGALIALRVSPALGGDKGCRPFPRTPFSAGGILPPLCSGQVSLDEAEHFLHNRDASVAYAPMVSESSRIGVRNHPGFSVRLRRNPHTSAQFAKILELSKTNMRVIVD